ncbi:MAG: hypothetical protein ACAF41_11945 [Leptolyngbya sp. BL-A-14]
MTAILTRDQRQGLRDGQPYSHWSYYINSLATTAQQFAEDACPLKLAQALENWGLIRTWVVNLFRLQGEASITKAQRRVAHDIHALFLLIQ